MKCSCKDININILLIIFIMVTNGKWQPVYSLYEEKSSQQVSKKINHFQESDISRFLKMSNSQVHRIVKKQMKAEKSFDRLREKGQMSKRKFVRNSNHGAAVGKVKLVGRPCHEFRRYTNLHDFSKFYECGVGQDGSMRLVQRFCSDGEEFSSRLSRCVVKRSDSNGCENKCNNGKKKPVDCPEPDGDLDDDVEPSNEWVDAAKGTAKNKVPVEFKPKPKGRLRIYHLHCKRRPGEASREKPVKRSYVIRVNKKKKEEQEFKEDENDEDEEDEEEEEEQQEDERNDPKKENVVDKIQKTGITNIIKNFKDGTKFAPKPRKVLLDADIRLNSAFGDALKKILNTRNLKVDPRRNRRNFITHLFTKKKTKLKEKEKNSDKEALVSVDHIINGVTSEFEREALIQKLEQRKNKADKLLRNEWRVK